MHAHKQDKQALFKKQVEMLALRNRPTEASLKKAGHAALPSLLEGLNHSNAKVRWWCLQILDHHADHRCVEAICRLLHDPVPRVRRMAVHTLGCKRCKTCDLKVDAVPHLVERLLNDPNEKVMREAMWVLSAFYASDPRAKMALDCALQREPNSNMTQWVNRIFRRQTRSTRNLGANLA